jgi:peptidoglycan/LPS O-acetylase OafA/YrhL
VETAGNRLAWLDALRGFAALCVVFDHFSYFILTGARAFLYRWFDFGQYGVFVFFLVSGYIIPASLERKGSIRGFWISRAFRLYPIYLLAIVVSVAGYAYGFGTVRGGQQDPLGAAASWLLMLPNLLSGPNVPNVTWTLSYEMVFYFLLAALFSVRAHRRTGTYALACGIVVITVGAWLPTAALVNGVGPIGANAIDVAVDLLVLVGVGLAVSGRGVAAGSWIAAITGLLLITVNQDHYPYPWSGYTILAFMFTGTLVYRAEQGQVSRAKAAIIAVLMLAMTVGGGLWDGAQHPNWATSGTQWQWQWVTSLLGAAVTFGIGLTVRKRRVPRVLAGLGMISFSLYLLHPLVISAYEAIPALSGIRSGWGQVPLGIGMLALVLGLSLLSYSLVEKPMQSAGRKVARRAARPMAPQDGDRSPEVAGT